MRTFVAHLSRSGERTIAERMGLLCYVKGCKTLQGKEQQN